MAFNRTIQTTNKLKKLQDDILNAHSPKAYLNGVVLSAIGENSNVPVELKAQAYSDAVDEIEKAITLQNKGEFFLDSTMIKFAFAILERNMSTYSKVESTEKPEPVVQSRRPKRAWRL